MKLASQEEVDAILKETREWATKHPMFRNETGTVALAVAEFAMNREDKTIYSRQAEFGGEE